MFANSPISVPTGEAIILLTLGEFTRPSNNPVFSEWNFGDGQLTNGTYMSRPGVVLNMTHLYEPGTYSISIRVSNKVSRYDLGAVIIAINLADNATLSTEFMVNEYGKLVFFHFSSPRALNGSLRTDFGDGITETHSVSNNNGHFVQNVDHMYSKIGNYSVKAVFFDEFQSYEMLLSHPVIIQKKLDQIILIAPAILGTPPEVAEIKVVSNSADWVDHVTCHWSIGGKMVAQTDYEKFTSSGNQSLLHRFSESGNIEISVTCRNRLSIVSDTKDIRIIKSISGFTADMKSYLKIDELFNVNLNVETGDDVEFIVSFDTSVIEKQNGTVLPVSLSHQYSAPDTYNVIIEAKNDVSLMEIAKVVNVLEPISGISVIASYKKTLISTEFIPGEGVNQNMFPIDRPVCFKASSESGNNVKYDWIVEHRSFETVDGELCHRFLLDGVYEIEVVARNSLYQSSGNITVYALKAVRISTLESDAPQNVNEKISFKLNLWKETTSPCFLWDMGDESPYYMFGSSNLHCVYLLSEIQNGRGVVFQNIENAQVLELEHVYSSEGTFDIHIKASNPVSFSSVNLRVSVLSIPCRYPKVSFNAYGNTLEVARKMKSSESLNVEAIVITDCGLNSDALYTWRVMKVNISDEGKELNVIPYHISQLQDSNENFVQKISFPPRTFDTSWFYRITMTVQMKMYPNISMTADQYIMSIPSPILIKFETTSRISYGHNVILDFTETHDPDDEPGASKDGWKLEIWCRRQNEVLFMSMHL